MSVYVRCAIVSALFFLLVTLQCHAKSAEEKQNGNRARRDTSWNLFSPFTAHQKCFARPCFTDAECCPGYACTGLRSINRRAMPLRSCALSMEGLEDLL